MRCPETNSAVPTAGTEAVFCYHVPIHTKHLPIMFFPVHNGEIIGGRVVELDAAITRRRQDLVLVDFRPGEVIERVLCGEPDRYRRQVSVYSKRDAEPGDLYDRPRSVKEFPTYHLTGTIPFAVSSRTYNLPFPTRPKLAPLATARRLSKKGEYFTA